MTHKSCFLISALLLVLTGCTATARTSSETTYRNEALASERLLHGGLALLPVVTAPGIEGYRRPFGDSIHEAVAGLVGDDQYVPAEAVMQRLNEEGLVDRYNEMIGAYRQTSILNQHTVRELGRALGTQYVLFVQLDPPFNETELRTSILTGDLEQFEHLGVSAFGQVWDTGNGNVVWEGTARSSIASTDWTYISAEDRDINRHSASVAHEIASQIFR